MLKTMYTQVGIDKNAKQATANNKHVEIFFKFIFILSSGDTAFLRRTSRESLNTLV